MRCLVIAAALLLAGPARGGDLGNRFELTLKRVLQGGPPRYDLRFLLADIVPEPGRRFTEFSGDVSGRWLGALALAEDSRPAGAALEAVLPEILKLQKPDGHFGAPFDFDKPTRDHMAMLWGNGRLLVGLLEAHRRTRDANALDAARRIGDFLIRIAPAMNSDAVQQDFDTGQFAVGYICWTNNIEGLAELFRITRHEPYRDVAAAIAKRTRFVPGQHSHGFLTSVRGILALHYATGDAVFLTQAEEAWNAVVSSGNVLVTGAVPEYFIPELKRTEGCSESDWLRLSLSLWRSTGKPRYLEQAESTLFNEFAMNQFSSGDFGHRVLVQTGIAMGGAAEGQTTAKAWWCCTLHGLRGYPEVFGSVFRVRDSEAWFDLPVDGRISAGGIALSAESSMQENAGVRIRVVRSPGTVTLHVRKPAWASEAEARVNGAPAAGVLEGSYLRIGRPLQPGDAIDVQYSLKTRIQRDGKGRVAIFHGPWLLGVNERHNPAFFDEPYQDNKLVLKPSADGVLSLRPASGAASHPFAVRVARFEVDYLPGGYAIQPGKATLTPVAEQTGMESVAWEYWLRLAPEK